jgi:pimeloyl-ACP methyl ester carboxylesterase
MKRAQVNGAELVYELPHAESFVLPRAGHLLHWENRSGCADGLIDFLTRHPFGDA